MSFKEAQLLIDAYNKDLQKQYELIRFNQYLNASIVGVKLDSQQDLIKFYWENEETVIETKEDIENVKQRLLELMKQV